MQNQILKNWQKVKFKDFITLQRGFDLPQYEFEDGDYPIMGSTGILGHHIKYKKNPPGVTTGRSGSLGTVLYTDEPYWPHNTSLWVKSFKGNDPRYVYYFLKTFPLEKFNSGAGVPTLNRNHLNEYKITIPNEQVQKKISSLLSNFDFLIENNKRKIKILEKITQLLYREWFVEFRFPGYKKVRFVDSELGKIPEGWDISKLRNHIKLDKGVSYSGEGLTEDGNPMVNLKSISVDGRYVRGSDKPYSGDYKPRHVLNPGDIVLANTDMTQNGNVVGKAAFVPVLDSDKEIIFSHHVYAIRLRKDGYLKRNFVLNLLNSYYFHGHAKGYAVGTTVLGLSADSIYRFKFVLPDNDISDLYEEKTSATYQLIENLENQNIVLQKTRDLLLPKLMFGEIDVSNLDIRTD